MRKTTGKTATPSKATAAAVAEAPRKVIYRNRRTQEELHAALEAPLQKQLERAEMIRKKIASLDNARFSTIAVLSKALPDFKQQIGEEYVVTPEFLVGVAVYMRQQLDGRQSQYDDLVALGEQHISKPAEELLQMVRRR
jgi:hypothetical protein